MTSGPGGGWEPGPQSLRARGQIGPAWVPTLLREYPVQVQGHGRDSRFYRVQLSQLSREMSSRISASTDIGRQTCPRMRLASWFWMTSPQSRSSGQSSWRGGHQVVAVRGGEEELTAAKVRSCPTTSQRPTATCRVAAASNSSVIFEAVPGSQGSGKSINEAGELAGFVALNGLADLRVRTAPSAGHGRGASRTSVGGR